MTTTVKPPPESWRLKIGAAKDLEVHWHHDPARHYSEGPLNKAQRATFKFFLQRLREVVDKRTWQVSIVFIPDNEEILANLANPSSTFHDMDQRRVEALKMCMLSGLIAGTSRPSYSNAWLRRPKPVFNQGQAFSLLYGNRVLAAHYISMAKPGMLKRTKL
jgi:hypothetical protein